MLAMGILSIVITVGCLSLGIWISHSYFSELPLDFTLAPPKRSDKPPEDWDKQEPRIKVPGSSTIHCFAPATGDFLGYVRPYTPDDIDKAVAQAKNAQKLWGRTDFVQRRQVLRTMLRFVLKNQETICEYACLDSGKTMVDAALGETLVTCEKLKWTIDHGEKALRSSKRPTNLLMKYKKNEVRYEPLGVVAALVSWNYPFHNFIGPVISALFTGNAIVVKASENTAWSALYWCRIAQASLSVCGHDPRLVQMVVCWPETANHLTSHKDISHVTFIGSRQVAHHVATAAAKSLTPLVAELGGKDAFIVLDSAKKDLTRVADIAVRGTFQSSGQNCVGVERIIACSAVYEPLIELLKPRIASIRLGSILNAKDREMIDMGAMVTSASFSRLENLIQSAVDQGAKLLLGGKRYEHPVHKRGNYFQPTLLVDVTTDMTIANEECFAPICLVMKAKNAEDAVRIANDPDFGLGSSVFGKENWELNECVRSIRSGMVSVNDFGVYYAVQLPFGGVGGSGYGRFGGEEGLRGLCNLKAVCRDRWPSMVKTSIPAPLRYPLKDTKKGWGMVNGITNLGYHPRWFNKAQALGQLAKNSM